MARVIGLNYRLPDASIHRMQGLMEALMEAPYHGKADIFALADSENLSAKESLPLFEALDLLGFSRISKGDIMLTSSGKACSEGDILERKKIFAYHLMRHIPLISYVYHELQEDPQQRIPKEKISKKLIELMSREDAENNLATIINWGRYAELFSYNHQTQMLNLENPEVEE
jgi:NitT/TauT family transport system ATP-binding protein